MKKILLINLLLLSVMFTLPYAATAEQLPESIGEKMAIKLTRGLANTATCIVELPKQTILTVRDMGAIGYVIGPIKGVGMTLYRGFIGVAETAFFGIPQPGYYDPMISPTYVWEGWEPKGDTSTIIVESGK